MSESCRTKCDFAIKTGDIDEFIRERAETSLSETDASQAERLADMTARYYGKEDIIDQCGGKVVGWFQKLPAWVYESMRDGDQSIPTAREFYGDCPVRVALARYCTDQHETLVEAEVEEFNSSL